MTISIAVFAAYAK